jgi:hypothetical protein
MQYFKLNSPMIYRLYNCPVQGRDCGDEASEWFSKFLSKPNVRLVQNVNVRPSKTYGAFSADFEKTLPVNIIINLISNLSKSIN